MEFTQIQFRTLDEVVNCLEPLQLAEASAAGVPDPPVQGAHAVMVEASETTAEGSVAGGNAGQVRQLCAYADSNDGNNILIDTNHV